MRRFMVTWCADIPVDENGDSNFEQADERFAWADSAEKAKAEAKMQASNAVFGYAEVQPWETCSRSEAMAEEDRETFKDKRGQWWIEAGEKVEVHAND